jgi:hypothetical protein
VSGATPRDFALVLLEYFGVLAGSANPNTAGLLDRLADLSLPPAPVLLISTRPASVFREQLAQRLHRPVALIDVAELDNYGFYERPTRHAV